MAKSCSPFSKFIGFAMGGLMLLTASVASAHNVPCKPEQKKLPSVKTTCRNGATPKFQFPDDFAAPAVYCGNDYDGVMDLDGGTAQCIVEDGATLTIHYKPKPKPAK
jgi:hypothetical protein